MDSKRAGAAAIQRKLAELQRRQEIAGAHYAGAAAQAKAEFKDAIVEATQRLADELARKCAVADTRMRCDFHEIENSFRELGAGVLAAARKCLQCRNDPAVVIAGEGLCIAHRGELAAIKPWSEWFVKAQRGWNSDSRREIPEDAAKRLCNDPVVEQLHGRTGPWTWTRHDAGENPQWDLVTCYDAAGTPRLLGTALTLAASPVRPNVPTKEGEGNALEAG